MPKAEILASSPRELWVYDDAFILRRKIADETEWLSGAYTFEAVSLALANAFRKKGHKAQNFRSEPILKEWNKPELTEDEKVAATKQLFAQLEMMQKNFEMGKETGGG